MIDYSQVSKRALMRELTKAAENQQWLKGLICLILHTKEIQEIELEPEELKRMIPHALKFDSKEEKLVVSYRVKHGEPKEEGKNEDNKKVD